MPDQSEMRKLAPRARDNESAGSHSFARRRGTDWVAYKGRPAAKPASPPAEKAPPPKEAQPQAPAAPKPSEPGREGGAGAGSQK